MRAARYGAILLAILGGLIILGLVTYSYLFVAPSRSALPPSEVLTSALIARTSQGAFLDKRAEVHPETAAPQLGYLAPDFELPVLAVQRASEGRTLRLSDFYGKPVLLNFWASWCPPCRKEMPDLQRFYERYGDRIVLLGVDWNDEPETARRFLQRFGITYPNVIDRDGEVFVAYRLTAVPTSFWIDRFGVIRGLWQGAMSLETMVEGFKKTTDVFEGEP